LSSCNYLKYHTQNCSSKSSCRYRYFKIFSEKYDFCM